jgi:hypothetical protein
MPVFTVAYEEPNGYKYVETSPELKELASGLPCFKPIEWPDYDTKVIEETINGKPVVIQLWKGWCQQIFSSPNFPGGIGGEVGIYERVEGRGLQAEKPDFMPERIWNLLREASKHGGKHFWWPVAEMNEIEYDFINPVTNTVVFHAGPQKTYWRNKWMDTADYTQYKKSTGKRWSWLPAWFPMNYRAPRFAAHNVMEYKINGKTYPRW